MLVSVLPGVATEPGSDRPSAPRCGPPHLLPQPAEIPCLRMLLGRHERQRACSPSSSAEIFAGRGVRRLQLARPQRNSADSVAGDVASGFAESTSPLLLFCARPRFCSGDGETRVTPDRTTDMEEARLQFAANPRAAGADAAMERYSNGDNAAFAELYDEIAPRLLGYLRKATRDSAAAEDLMQQTFLQMHRARGTFIPGAPVMPWALAVAKRLMIDNARRRNVELGFMVDTSVDDDRIAAGPADSASADDLLDAHRVEHRVQQRLDAMPETHRTAYRLVKEEGMSLKRAAELLGTTIPAVKLRTHRAYRALRAVLRENGGPL